MRIDVEQMLKRAADFQKLTDPDDALSAMIQEISADMELDESALDQIAAAAHSSWQPPQISDCRKQR